MGRILNLNSACRYYIILDGVRHEYCGLGRVGRYFDIDKLLLDKQYYAKTIKEGYKFYSKLFLNARNEAKEFYIPVSEIFIEFYQQNWRGSEEDLIYLYNMDLDNNIDSFYQMSLEIEVGDFRTRFFCGYLEKDKVYIDRPFKDEILEEKLLTLFGEPQAPSDLGECKYSPIYCYIVPISRIDKIIGLKHFCDKTTISREDGGQFTGETEELILDLHHFDENIYTLLREHGLLEIKEDAIVEIEKSDSEESETKKSVMEKPIEKNSFGQFVRNWMSKIFFLFDKSSS